MNQDVITDKTMSKLVDEDEGVCLVYKAIFAIVAYYYLIYFYCVV